MADYKSEYVSPAKYKVSTEVMQKIRTEREYRDRVVARIKSTLIPETDDWSKGLNTGLEWAIRILNGDKSAS